MNKFLFGGGGAETVLLTTVELLRQRGHEVSVFATKDERDIDPGVEVAYAPARRYFDERSARAKVADAAASIYSVQARQALRAHVRRFRPDVAHLHNVYHQLSLSVIDELSTQGVPIVLTVHDYKPVCPSYTCYTGGEICHRCSGRSLPIDVVRHRCIRGSRAASSVALAEAALVRVSRKYDKVGRFIAPSIHMAEALVAGGIRGDRVAHLPNFVPANRFVSKVHPRQPFVAYLGRLERVKGVEVILDAAKALKAQVPIVIAGRGEMTKEVQLAANAGLLEFRGLLDWSGVCGVLDSAAAILLPAVWEENCPMILLEAGARGCPVIVSDLGGLPELVQDGEDGMVVKAGDAHALVAAIRRVTGEMDATLSMSQSRLQRTLVANGEDAHYEALLKVFAATSSVTDSGRIWR